MAIAVWCMIPQYPSLHLQYNPRTPLLQAPENPKMINLFGPLSFLSPSFFFGANGSLTFSILKTYVETSLKHLGTIERRLSYLSVHRPGREVYYQDLLSGTILSVTLLPLRCSPLPKFRGTYLHHQQSRLS